MDPLSIAGMAIGGLTSFLSAGAQMKQARHQSNVELWKADQERSAAYKEAASVGQSAVDQSLRATRAYRLASDIALSNAEIERGKAQLAENRARDGNDAAIASQRSFFASANIDPNSGSPLMLAAEGAAQGEQDVAILRAGTAQGVAEQAWSAYGATESGDYALKTASATIDGVYDTASTRAAGVTAAGTIAAQNARMAGVYGAASTVLNQVSSWGKTLATPKGGISF